MYISNGHFLAPHMVAIKDGKPCKRLMAIDTEMMVAVRLVGFDPHDGSEITDLVKIDDVFFIAANMDPGLKELIPDGFKLVETTAKDKEG